MNHRIAGVLIAVAALASLHSRSEAQTAPAQQPPRFRSAVDVLPLDVSVIDNQGRPVLGLTPADFKVFVDGAPRRVVSVEWASLVSSDGVSPVTTSVPEGYSSNDHASGGRLIVLVIDQPNIRFGGGRALVSTMNRFIDHLSPSDHIAAVGLGPGGPPSVPFTTDHERVKAAISRMNGQRQVYTSAHGLDPAIAAAITHGDTALLDEIVDRECPMDHGRFSQKRAACRQEILEDADYTGQVAKHEGDTTIDALLNLLSGLGSIDAPKTVVLVSEGPAVSDGDAETASRLVELGARAASTRSSLYALRLDDGLFNMTATTSPLAANRRIRSQGLAMLTAAARGALFTVTGSGEAIFDRIERELSGYYLIGVETDPRDAEGKPRALRVEVAKPGVEVRARRLVVAPSPSATPGLASTREALGAALASPVLASALPLQAITFNLQGPDPGKVQLLIRAEIGTGYTSPQSLIVTYMILDPQGRIVDSQSFAGRLTPSVAGMASALLFSAGASLLPGDYTLKLAVADGDKIGTVEHAIHASLNDAGAVKLSDLIVGGPVPYGEPTRPTVDYVARFGVVQGYLESYGATVRDMKVRYDIVANEQAPVLVSAEVTGRPAGESRMLFTGFVSTSAIPPGKYRLRANVSLGESPLTTLSRAFEIPAPNASAPSSVRAGDVPTKAELFLPIAASDLALPFQVADALSPETLRPFAERVPPALRRPFDEGINYLRSGDNVSAERSFKQAVQPDTDMTAALTYLAVSMAASGHDVEASSAWQTALVHGSDLPQIYVWLGDALLRARELSRARSILEEARSRWPTDSRFARPLAMFYASVGQGDEAVRLLERYIGDGHRDQEVLYLGVQWIYHIRINGGVVHSPAEDLKLARSYAQQYATAKGPNQALVRQWISYLEKADQ